MAAEAGSLGTDEDVGERCDRACQGTRVAAVFHSDEALEAAAEALLLAGFDRADLDCLADPDEVRERLGLIYVAHEELADVPQVPRRPLVQSKTSPWRWYWS